MTLIQLLTLNDTIPNKSTLLVTYLVHVDTEIYSSDWEETSVCWLVSVLESCQCISETDLLRQLCVLVYLRDISAQTVVCASVSQGRISSDSCVC